MKAFLKNIHTAAANPNDMPESKTEAWADIYSTSGQLIGELFIEGNNELLIHRIELEPNFDYAHLPYLAQAEIIYKSAKIIRQITDNQPGPEPDHSQEVYDLGDIEDLLVE